MVAEETIKEKDIPQRRYLPETQIGILKKRRTFKKWLLYKYKRLRVRFRRNSKSIIKKMDGTDQQLNEIQRPLYDICMKLISDPHSELICSITNSILHIENENYLIIIRSNLQPTEAHSISLVEHSQRENPGFIDVPFPAHHVKIIVEKFDKEIAKRMKNNQLLKTSKVSARLQNILKEIEGKVIS